MQLQFAHNYCVYTLTGWSVALQKLLPVLSHSELCSDLQTSP